MKDQPSEYSPDKWYRFVKKTDQELLRECRTDVFKGSGRGGQKRNKTSNAIRLVLAHHSVSVSDTRSKSTNQQIALSRLRMAIATDTSQMGLRRPLEHVFKQDILPYTRENIIRINPKNPDFPAFVGHLVDQYIVHRGDWKKTAASFGVSASQIHRFVEKHESLPAIFAKIRNALAKDGDEVVH